MESSTVSDALDAILDDHQELVDAAEQGSETAENRLVAKVMNEAGVAADAASAALSRALSGGEFEEGVDVEGFMEYMDQITERGDRSPSTAEAYIVSVRKFDRWYSDVRDPTSPPTDSDVKDWLDHLALEEDLKGSSIQRHFHGVKSYFSWEGRGGELADIDVSEEYPDRSGGTPDYLDWDEVEKLRKATRADDPDVICYNTSCGKDSWGPAKDPSDYSRPPRCPSCDTTDTGWERRPYEFAITQLLSGLGVRVGELVAVKQQDVDVDDRKIQIKRQKRTSEWVDPMYLLPADVRAIKLYRRHREEYPDEATESDYLFITARERSSGWAAGTDFIRNKLKDVAIRAGVRTFEDDDGNTRTEVSPHILRHSVGAKLAQNGYNEYQVGRYLGHSQGTTGGYMALARDDLKEMREVIG